MKLLPVPAGWRTQALRSVSNAVSSLANAVGWWGREADTFPSYRSGPSVIIMACDRLLSVNIRIPKMAKKLPLPELL